MRLLPPLHTLRRWLRHTWISKLPLAVAWPQRWRHLFAPAPAAGPNRRRSRLPALEQLETRFVPNDLFGPIRTPEVIGGVVLVSGRLKTPMGVAMDGWADQALLAAHAPSAVPAETERPGPVPNALAPSAVSPWWEAWQPSERDREPAAPARSTGHADGAATPSGAASSEPVHQLGLPRTDADWLRSPLDDSPDDAGRHRHGANLGAEEWHGSGGGGGGGRPASEGEAAPPIHPDPAPLAAAAGPNLGFLPAQSGSSGLGKGGDTPTQANLDPTFSHVPLAFEPNLGQTDPQVQFLSHNPGFQLFLTGAGATFSFADPTQQVAGDVVALQFVGANPGLQGQTGTPLPSTSNYLLGSDPGQWVSNVPQYAGVVYHDLYPGIDLDYLGTGRQLEFQFVVAPGADPSVIQMAYQGMDSLGLDDQGNLDLNTPWGAVMQEAPVVYQTRGGLRQVVASQEVLQPNNQVGFQVGGYDTSQPLVIDPTLNFSTYLGGSGSDQAFAVATDVAGNSYLTGTTASSNFPTTTGVYQTGLNGTSSDVFVTKVNASGTALVYSTYLGGTKNDQANAIAVDTAGEAYITGMTFSSDFPTTAGAVYSTGHPTTTNTIPFFTKLNATGTTLAYSTYFLTPTTYGSGNAVQVDSGGRAVVAGGSTGNLSPYDYQAWVMEVVPVSTTTTTVYSLTMGGSTGGGSSITEARGLALDGGGNAYVTGDTSSTGFVTVNPLPGMSSLSGPEDAFVAKVSGSGSVPFASFLGGTGTDIGYGIGRDSAGDVDVVGSTTSSSLPNLTSLQGSNNGGAADAFIAQVNPALTALNWTTFLGGSGEDEAYAVAVDAPGNLTVVGRTASSTFPTANPFQSSYGGNPYDGFLSKINVTGTSFIYSTFLGGSGEDQARGVALDPLGNAIVDGFTLSTNFPTVNPIQPHIGSSTAYDAFLARVTAKPAAPVITSITPDTGASGSDQITNPAVQGYTTLTVNGTATTSSTVTLYQVGVAAPVGMATASGTAPGSWSVTINPAPPQGVYAYTATASLGGLTGPLSSPPFVVVVDTAAPQVAVTPPPAPVYSLGPLVRVSATDNVGLPNTTPDSLTTLTVYNSGGTQVAQATGYMLNGAVNIKVPNLPALGTYTLKASTTDLAGNVGTSPTTTFQVVSNPNPGQSTFLFPTSDPLQDRGWGPLDDGPGEAQLGNVFRSVPLDLDNSPGTAQSGNPALVYNSETVNVRPVVQDEILTDNSQPLPATLSIYLQWNGTDVPTVTYSIPGNVSPGDLLVVAAQAPAAVAATGRYPWRERVTLNYTTPQVGDTTTYSYVVVRDNPDNPFGAGWSFSGTDQLISFPLDSVGPAGILRVYGTGGYRFYQDNGGGSYLSPPNDNGLLTFTAATSQYQYQSPDGQTWVFNSKGRQTNWKSPDGQEVLTYTYASGPLTTLTTMKAIDGTRATFTYAATSGLLSTVTTASRTTTFQYAGAGLTQVTNPDGGVHTFAYDGTYHLTGETFANLQNQWTYSAYGSEASYVWGNSTSPSTYTLNPADIVGLAGPVLGPPQASQVDPVGNTTTWQMDGLGRTLLETSPDQGVTGYVLDNAGRVSVVTDPLNRVTTYTRDGLGYVTQETLPDGHSRTYAYQTPFHALTTFTDERGDTTLYAYDNGTGHLTSTTDALTEVTSFGYSTSGLLTSVTDPRGDLTTFQYDSSRRLSVVTDALNNKTTLAYDSNGNPVTLTNARNYLTTTSYDVMNRLTQVTNAAGEIGTWTYNAAGLPLTAVDPLGHQTSYVYDGTGRGLVSDAIEAVGTTVQRDTLAQYDADGRLSGRRNADGWWTYFGYDPMSRPDQVVDALGGQHLAMYDLDGELTASRDALGRWTGYSYSNRGWLVQVQDPLNLLTTMGYDAAGNLTSVQDPLSDTTGYAYDKLNRVSQVTDPVGNLTTFQYDAAGNLGTVIDARVKSWTFGYDKDNREVSATKPSPPAGDTTTLTYDPVGNVIAVTDGLGHTTSYGYDQVDRLVSSQDALLNTTTFSYDHAGDLTQVQDPLLYRTTYSYDALNRQVAVEDANLNTTTLVLDAQDNLVATIDPLSHVQATGFDPLDRPVTSVDARGATTVTGLDLAGNVTGVTDPATPTPNVTAFNYDNDNRLTLRTDATGAVTTLAYDNASRLTSETDRLGRSIAYKYDADSRVTAETWKSAAGVTVNLQTFAYNQTGELTKAADSSGSVTFTYDNAGRVKATTDVWGQVLTYSYDAADRLTQVQDGPSSFVTSSYDAADRLTARWYNNGSVTVQVNAAYNARNELTTLSYQYNSGVVATTAYSYDPASRLTSEVTRNASAATLSYYNYGYDNANRVTSESWQSAAQTGTVTGSRAYGYDAANEVTSDGTSTYSYDLAGNRTQVNSAVYQTGTANRVSNDGTYTYTYDAEGNLVGKSNTTDTYTYGYDNLNRLTSVLHVSSGTTVLYVTYTYDALDRRVAQAESAGSNVGTLHFAYDGGAVWADLDGSNTLQVRYINGNGANQVWARIQGSGAGATVAYFVADRLGSVRDLVDSSGLVQDHLDYDAFGKVTETNAGYYNDRHKWQGGEYDADTGLYHFGARYYDTATGRWTSEDPLGFAAGDGNLYRAMGNDTANATDPSGLAPPKLGQIETNIPDDGLGDGPGGVGGGEGGGIGGGVGEGIGGGIGPGIGGGQGDGSGGPGPAPGDQPGGADGPDLEVGPNPEGLTGDPGLGLGSHLSPEERARLQEDTERIWQGLRDLASLGADFIPGVSALKGWSEVLTGHDYISGRDLSTLDRGLALLNVIPAGRWLGKGGKWLGKFLWGTREAEEALKLEKDVVRLENNLSRNIAPKAGQVVDEVTDAEVEAAITSLPAHFAPKASELPLVRPGTAEWDKAVEEIASGGKVNVRVPTATDAKDLLREARGNMNRYKRYTDKPYNKGYEMHPEESGTKNAPHNDLPHVKWKDWQSSDGGSGHIFFDIPN